MYAALVEIGILVGDYVYHRWFQDQPSKPNPGKSIKVPTTTAGQTIPIYYGQVLVKTPVLAWWGPAHVYPGAAAPEAQANADWLYAVDQFYVVGIGFSGFAQVELKNIYAGELRLNMLQFDSGGVPYVGDGGLQPVAYTQWPAENIGSAGNTSAMGGGVQYLNGHPTQTMVDASGNATNDIAALMMLAGINPFAIPGYRGYTSVGLYARGTLGFFQWVIGTEPQPPSYAFEVRSTPDGAGSGFFVYPDGSVDVNPIDIVYDLLTGTMGKLGLDPSKLDSSSLTAAAVTLKNEGHGMSRVWDDGQDAKAYLDEIMAQIDGVYYEDPSTGLFCVKLIRPDYDPNAILVVDPSNCSKLDNFAASGWSDITNKIRVMFTNRLNAYRDGTATAQNQANAVGQDGAIREVQLQFPGVTQQELAETLATRELAARSRPLIKCRATLSAAFWRTHVGDVLMVNWPDANISHIAMRVAAVSRGTLEDGSIIVDLIQDYFYQWRNRQPVSIFDIIKSLGAVTFGLSF